MAEHLAYETAKRKNKPIEFSIDGEDYEFTPPKKAAMILPIIDQDDVDDMGVMSLKAEFDWLGAGLPEDQAKRLMDKLRDPKDDFDTDDAEKILKWIMKQVEGRPTG